MGCPENTSRQDSGTERFLHLCKASEVFLNLPLQHESILVYLAENNRK